MSVGEQQQRIREMAYELWLARGCPQGSSLGDWVEAERIVQHQDPHPSRDFRPKGQRTAEAAAKARRNALREMS